MRICTYINTDIGCKFNLCIYWRSDNTGLGRSKCSTVLKKPRRNVYYDAITKKSVEFYFLHTSTICGAIEDDVYSWRGRSISSNPRRNLVLMGLLTYTQSVYR